jgi:hypothetical protein
MPSPWLQSVLLLLKQVAVKLEFFCWKKIYSYMLFYIYYGRH